MEALRTHHPDREAAKLGRDMITGILEILAAIGLQRVISGEWALIVGGVASVIFGVLLAVWPNEGLLALAWI